RRGETGPPAERVTPDAGWGDPAGAHGPAQSAPRGPSPTHRSRRSGRGGGDGGIPAERVGVGEVPGVAVEGDAVRTGALLGHTGEFREAAALVEGEADRVGVLRGELRVLPAETLGGLQALLGVELLARLDVLDAQEQDDVVDRAGGGAGVLLVAGDDLPDRAVGRLHDAAVAPQRLRGRLQLRGPGLQGRFGEAVHI